MDKERKKRRQTIRIIITEIIMVIAVIFTAIIITFLAMGYNVDQNGEVSQFGLAQINSLPTGATITIDDDTLLFHTNTSKMLSAGTHHIKLERSNYDTWAKDVEIKPGILLRLDYPRLFLKDRTKENAADNLENFEIFSVSPDRNYLLYTASDDIIATPSPEDLKDRIKKRATWTLLDVKGDKPEKTEFDFTEILGNHTITDILWSKTNDRILAKTTSRDKTEWLLINLKNPQNSLNLTAKYSLDFSTLTFLDGNSDHLLGIENGNLRNITLSSQSVSGVLAKDVRTFSHSDSALAYINSANELKFYEEDGDDIIIKTLSSDNSKVILASYLDKKYLSFIDGNHLYVYRSDYEMLEKAYSKQTSSSAENSTESENSNASPKGLELIVDQDLGYSPNNFYTKNDGEFIVTTSSDNKISVFDAELELVSNFTISGNSIFWLDQYLIGTIENDTLTIYDFDGTNRRELVSNFKPQDSTKSHSNTPAFITKSNHYLYYQNDHSIIYEKIVD